MTILVTRVYRIRNTIIVTVSINVVVHAISISVYRGGRIGASFFFIRNAVAVAVGIRAVRKTVAVDIVIAFYFIRNTVHV